MSGAERRLFECLPFQQLLVTPRSASYINQVSNSNIFYDYEQWVQPRLTDLCSYGLYQKCFFRRVQIVAYPEDNFRKLAQLVKIWTMRPAVDNVYFASAFVIPQDAYTAHAPVTCGMFYGFRRRRLFQLSNFLTTIYRPAYFSRMIRYHEHLATRASSSLPSC